MLRAERSGILFYGVVQRFGYGYVLIGETQFTSEVDQGLPVKGKGDATVMEKGLEGDTSRDVGIAVAIAADPRPKTEESGYFNVHPVINLDRSLYVAIDARHRIPDGVSDEEELVLHLVFYGKPVFTHIVRPEE